MPTQQRDIDPVDPRHRGEATLVGVPDKGVRGVKIGRRRRRWSKALQRLGDAAKRRFGVLKGEESIAFWRQVRHRLGSGARASFATIIGPAPVWWCEFAQRPLGWPPHLVGRSTGKGDTIACISSAYDRAYLTAQAKQNARSPI